MTPGDKQAHEERLAAIEAFSTDRWLAHEALFAHRHPDASPQAHVEMVEAIYQPGPRVGIEGFRGFGKSTRLEEAVIIKAGFREFHNLVIVGSSYNRAVDRLASVKREIEINTKVRAVFGQLRGSVWQTGKIVLASGACVQALGRDQSMVGIKHLDWRPDAALVDDVEDPEETRTDAEREGTWNWFIKSFLPSLDHPIHSWVRVLGTRRGTGSLPERLEKDGWPTKKFPIEHLDEKGERRATWPAKFPIPVIDEMKETYRGDMDTWAQEYMCQTASAAHRVFRRETIRVAPRVRTWEASYAMYDPARTTHAKSATTGWAVWSWIRNRLIVWDGGAELWLPDQILAHIFGVAEEYGPVWIGVEEDGLNEWIRQPLRQEQARRGISVPVRPLRAPRGKLDFIRGLQPYFEAGEVEFAKAVPDLEAQLLSFPSGKIDAPNALAYALTLRPGAPIYDGFTQDHIAEALARDPGRPLWLACNATHGLVTAVAVQHGAGRTRILADWAIEEEPEVALALLAREIGMNFRSSPTICCGPAHYDRYMNVGLVQAAQGIPLAVEVGVEPSRGRAYIRNEFARLDRGIPALQVSRAAKLTLNALAGGYSRALNKGAGLSEEAEPGMYRLLMEGLESCLGRMSSAEAVDSNANWSYTATGRPYQRYGPAIDRR